MKKFIIILLSLVLFVFCVGCGTYVPPTDLGGDGSGNTSQGGEEKPGKPGDNVDPPDDWEKDEMVFTVTLNIKNSNGELVRYSPRPSDNIFAQWTGEGGAGNFTAKFNSMGVASCKGLDGEYRVTLSNLPSDRIYDPNGIYVDNDFRDVSIELFDVLSTSGTGKGLYVQQGTCIPLNSVGTYKATVEKAYVKGQSQGVEDGSIIYFEYTPTEPGYYSLESMVDVEDGKINPLVDVFRGTSQFKLFYETIDGGGIEGDFTKNFKWEMRIQEGFTGNCFTFGIKADIVNGVSWPVDIYFRLIYVGATIPTEIVQAKGPFLNDIYPNATVQGTWQWSFLDNPKGGNRYSTSGDKRYELYWNDLDGNGIWTPAEWKDTNGNGVFDQGDEWLDMNGNGIFDDADRYRDTNKNGKFDILDEWWDTNGDGICGMDTGDGFYHEFDLEKYPDGYTDPITGATYPAGFGPLLWTIIGGWDAIYHNYTGAPGDPPPPPIPIDNLLGMASDVNGKNYNYFLEDYNKHTRVQQTYTERGGSITTTIHPVNKELMEALQALAPARGYFQDGDGFAEVGDPDAVYQSPYFVDSDEDHMWFVFCGYYR